MYDVYSCGFDGVIVRPKRAHKQQIQIFQHFLTFKEATGNLEPAATKRVGPALGALWGHFGVTLGPVLVSVGDLASLDGHFAIIVESLWVYEGPFSKKHSFFPTDVNDFIKPLGEMFRLKVVRIPIFSEQHQ